MSNNIKNVTNKINNVDSHLSGNINQKVNKAQESVDYLKQANKTTLDRASTQSKIKNFFDSDVRKAKSEISAAESNLRNMQKNQSMQKQNALKDFNKQRDRAIADMDMFKKHNGISELESGVSDAQAAYDKAVRATNKSRTAVAGAGIGAYTLNNINKSKKQNTNHTTPYYQAGLNNTF